MLFRLTLLFTLLALPLRAAEVTDFTLDNGLEVVVIEDHRAPVVVHMVWYRIGAADEPPGKSGIAHFLEHLMFKGTDELGPGEFSDIVAAQGGSDNAFTSYDYTAYFQRVAADRLELMMKMEADRMADLDIRPETVVTERDVILEERNTRTDNDPAAIFGEQRSAAQYLASPYGIPVIGWRHEIAELGLDDAVEFYQDFYAPNNAILVVAGDVDPEEVRQLAETYYGPLAPNPDLQPRKRSQEPPQLAERRLTYEDPRVAQPYVIRTYLAPERDPGAQDEAAALVMLSEILGGSPTTSYLGRKLQFEEQTAIYASAFYSGLSVDDTTFGLIVVPSPGVSLDAAESSLDAALEGFLEEGVDPEQFARIKMQIRADEVYALDSLDTLARRYGQGLSVGLSLEDIEAWPDALQSVTEDDVMAAARAVLDKRRAVTGFLTAPPAAEAAATPASMPAAQEQQEVSQ